MPTYQYACTSCGHRLEAVQSFSDEPLSTCPECEGKLRKLFSSVGIVFKGSGFYRTDSRTPASAGAAKGGSGSSTESSGSASAGSDSSGSGSPGSGSSGSGSSGSGSPGSGSSAAASSNGSSAGSGSKPKQATATAA